MVSPHHAASLPRYFVPTCSHLRPHVPMSSCTYQESIDPSLDHTPSLPSYTPSSSSQPYTPHPNPSQLQHSPPHSSNAAIYPPESQRSCVPTPDATPYTACYPSNHPTKPLYLPSFPTKARSYIAIATQNDACINRSRGQTGKPAFVTHKINECTYVSFACTKALDCR